MKYIHNTAVVPWCKRYCKNHNLEYTRISEYQHRVKNILTGKYVDFWNTGSIRDSKGKFHRIGSTRRGFGIDNLGNHGDWNNEIKDEIKQLII